jgi:hypothetical protein
MTGTLSYVQKDRRRFVFLKCMRHSEMCHIKVITEDTPLPFHIQDNLRCLEHYYHYQMADIVSRDLRNGLILFLAKKSIS